MRLDDVQVPDSGAARLAEEVAGRYASPALYAHSVRSYLWAAAYAQVEGIRFDAELLYVASALHDLGLTEPFDSHRLPFEEAGGELAWVFCAGVGWPAARRERAHQIIVRHMWPSVDPADDAEGHLLEVGTSIDIGGSGLDRIPTGLQREVVTRWPRGGLAAEFADCFRDQAARKPDSRAAAAVSAGIADRLRAHPLDDA